jgi:two-component system OmpR family response regulator
VVLDIGLPGLDGYAVARQLRERGDTSHVLLIALTGYGQKEDRARAAAAGFDYHYVKPADPREIQAAIERGRNTAGEPSLEAHRIGRAE